MLKESLEIIKQIHAMGFESYIVGGFVRDYYMDKESYDVDISTSAAPKDLIEIFQNAILPKEKYGTVTLNIKNIRYEINTFRKEISYENRRPINLEYSSDFMEDINRRDFVMNTLCMDYKGKIIDVLNGKEDIDNQIIRSVGDPFQKFEEDPLRILRAIRFATQLDFKLEEKTKIAIVNKGLLLTTLSYDRKKSELNKIFLNKNAKYGIKLLNSLGLSKYLDIYNLNNIKLTSDVLGIWAQLDVLDKYPFTKLEKSTINIINEIVGNKVIGNKELYKYGLYNCTIAGEILNIDKKNILRLDKDLPIHSKKEIKISTQKMCNIKEQKPGEWIKKIYFDLEDKILSNKLENNEEVIEKYLLENY